VQIYENFLMCKNGAKYKRYNFRGVLTFYFSYSVDNKDFNKNNDVTLLKNVYLIYLEILIGFL
ncbi:hypothetical protein, partial [Xylanibacter rodentium]